MKKTVSVETFINNSKTIDFRTSRMRCSAETSCEFCKASLNTEDKTRIITKRGQQNTSRAAKRIYPLYVSLFWSIWSPQRSPKRPPRAPKRSPRELYNAHKTIFKDKTMIFQKSMNLSAKIKVSEVRMVILEAQNRPEEAA